MMPTKTQSFFFLAATVAFAAVATTTFIDFVTTSDANNPKTAAAATSFELIRSCPHRTPQEAYQRWLRGWRVDNFGQLSIAKPNLIEWGDENTGVGNIVERPGGIRESIVRSSLNKNITYTVLNPMWYQFPVEHYESTVMFRRDGNGGTVVEWRSNWTPMPRCNWVVRFLVRTVLNLYIPYVVQ